MTDPLSASGQLFIFYKTEVGCLPLFGDVWLDFMWFLADFLQFSVLSNGQLSCRYTFSTCIYGDAAHACSISGKLTGPAVYLLSLLCAVCLYDSREGYKPAQDEKLPCVVVSITMLAADTSGDAVHLRNTLRDLRMN